MNTYTRLGQLSRELDRLGREIEGLQHQAKAAAPGALTEYLWNEVAKIERQQEAIAAEMLNLPDPS